MNYRIVEKPAFRVVGVMKRVALIYRGVNPEIVALASTLDGEKIALLKSLSNVEPAGMISASVNINEGWAEGSQLDHYIGVATTLEAPSGLASLDVSAGVWGVFESVGPFPETLQNTWERIYTEWFPTSGYQLAPGPAIVWNESPDTSSPTYHSEIWTPIVKR